MKRRTRSRHPASPRHVSRRHVSRRPSIAFRCRLPLGPRSYDFVLAPDCSRLAVELRSLAGLGRRAFLVTDRRVARHWGREVVRELREAGLEVSGAVLPAGEGAKSLRRFGWLMEQMSASGLDRADTVFALGGGVVGDLAGFAAAAYLRGIAWVELPTTLLAMVDSAIGGKVGVNLSRGKNLAGAIHQPRLVYAPLAALDTLPDREFRAGLAEVVKAGMIADPALIALLEAEMESVLAREPLPLAAMIARAVRVKMGVVAADEREGGRRAVLNYGHTFGHAIEAATGFRQFKHGEAVSLGMVAAGELAARLGVASRRTIDRQNQLLARAGLPLRAPRLRTPAIMAKLLYDKKIRDGKLRFVLTSRVGVASLREHPVDHHLRHAIRSITME
jgi:3-dehydroquinate synthase